MIFGEHRTSKLFILENIFLITSKNKYFFKLKLQRIMIIIFKSVNER